MVSSRAEALVGRLEPKFGASVRLADQSRQRDGIRVTTINACTGIEAPVVFLVGVDALIEIENALQLDNPDRDQIVRQNTKKLFVAMTRAARKLTILHVRPETRSILAGHRNP